MYVSEHLGVKTEFLKMLDSPGFFVVHSVLAAVFFFHLAGYVRLLEMGL